MARGLLRLFARVLRPDQRQINMDDPSVDRDCLSNPVHAPGLREERGKDRRMRLSLRQNEADLVHDLGPDDRQRGERPSGEERLGRGAGQDGRPAAGEDVAHQDRGGIRLDPGADPDPRLGQVARDDPAVLRWLRPASRWLVIDCA